MQTGGKGVGIADMFHDAADRSTRVFDRYIARR
jgi:hypothetical protein